MFRACLASTAILLFAQPVLAQSVVVTGGVELEFVFDDDDSTQALIGYYEAEVNGFYAGIWGQLANEDILNEIDLYIGYRGEAGKLAYDVSYTRYYFPEDGGDCCGEIGVDLAYAVTDQLSLGTELNYDPEAELGSAYLLADYAFTDQWAVAAKYGFYEDGVDRPTEWELGVSYALTDSTAIALTYLEGEDYDAYFKLNLTWDYTVLSR